VPSRASLPSAFACARHGVPRQCSNVAHRIRGATAAVRETANPPLPAVRRLSLIKSAASASHRSCSLGLAASFSSTLQRRCSIALIIAVALTSARPVSAWQQRAPTLRPWHSHHTLSSTHFHRSWRGLIEHDFEQRRCRSRGTLLALDDRLGICRPAGFPIGLLELRQSQPTQQCASADTSCFRRLIDVALSEQRRDGVAGHYLLSQAP
jgi:hypothetical protein